MPFRPMTTGLVIAAALSVVGYAILTRGKSPDEAQNTFAAKSLIYTGIVPDPTGNLPNGYFITCAADKDWGTYDTGNDNEKITWVTSPDGKDLASEAQGVGRYAFDFASNNAKGYIGDSPNSRPVVVTLARTYVEKCTTIVNDAKQANTPPGGTFAALDGVTGGVERGTTPEPERIKRLRNALRTYKPR